MDDNMEEEMEAPFQEQMDEHTEEEEMDLIVKPTPRGRNWERKDRAVFLSQVQLHIEAINGRFNETTGTCTYIIH